MLPRFTDEKTEAWKGRPEGEEQGARPCGLHPGLHPHPHPPNSATKKESSGSEWLERLDQPSARPTPWTRGVTESQRGPGLWGYDSTPSRNGIGGSVERPLNTLCATDSFFFFFN